MRGGRPGASKVNNRRCSTKLKYRALVLFLRATNGGGILTLVRRNSMHLTNPEVVHRVAGRLLRAGMIAGVVAVLLGAGSLFATSHRNAEAASVPGPVAQAPMAVLPDIVACDSGFTPTFGFFGGFGS